MAMDKDSPLKEKFRFLLVQIGNELHSKNCKALKFGYKINIGNGDESEDGLDILSELMKKGMFDAFKPDKLLDILKMIDRKDLLEIVNEYKESTLFREETKIKKRRSLLKKLRHHSHSFGDEQPPKHMEKCWSTIAKTLSHMTIMLEQTTTLVSSVETFMGDESRKKEVQDSITKTKEELEDLSIAIQDTVTEVEGVKNHWKDDGSKPSEIPEDTPKERKLTVRTLMRGRSGSDSNLPGMGYFSLDSPKLRLANKGQPAVMMMWPHTSEQHWATDSDTETHQRRKSTGFMAGSEHAEKSVPTCTTGTADETEQPEGSIDSPNFPDEPQTPSSAASSLRLYLDIPILTVNDECPIDKDKPSSSDYNERRHFEFPNEPESSLI